MTPDIGIKHRGIYRGTGGLSLAAFRELCLIYDAAECEKAELSAQEKRQRAMLRILAAVRAVTGIPIEELNEADVCDLLICARTAEFAAREVIVPKFARLAPGDAEKETDAAEDGGSLFDEYDRAEGYEEETAEGGAWCSLADASDRLIRFAVKALGESFSGARAADAAALLDHAAFELECNNEGQ